MVRTIPLRNSSKVAPAPRTRSSSTPATTTTQRRSVAATNSSLSNPYKKKYPPPSGSPTTTPVGKRKKRAWRTLPLSAPVAPPIPAPVAPSIPAPVAPLRPDPLVAPLNPDPAAAAPTIMVPAIPMIRPAPAPPSIPAANAPPPLPPLIEATASAVAPPSILTAVVAPPPSLIPAAAPAPVAPPRSIPDGGAPPSIPDGGDPPSILDAAVAPSSLPIDDLVPTVSYDEEEEEESDGEVDTAVAAAAAGVTVTDFHLPSVTDPTIPTLSVDSENDFRKAAIAASEGNFSLGAILNSLKQNPTALGTTTERIKALTLNTTRHERSKNSLEFAFFKSLAAHPEAAPLVDFIPDPEAPMMEISCFYVVTRASIAPNKRALVNWCMLIHSLDFYQVKYRGHGLSKDPRLFAQAQYQSGTQDFNEAGGFQAYWKNIFKIAKTYKTDFSTCPNKAHFNVNWYKKWNKAINDPSNLLDLFNNLKHFVWCAMENIMTKWALRDCLEPSSIVKEDFETGPNYNGQKKRSLSLKNPVLDDRNTKKTTLPCPYNGDPMSTYQTTIKLLSLVPDNCEGVNWISHKPASKKQKEASNPERCTAHGKRHESISKVANAGVSASLVKGLGGHAHLNTTTNYILPDQQAVDAAVRAKHGSPSKIRVPLPGPAQALAPAKALAPTCALSPSPSPAPTSPASSAEESQDPALHVDDSPAVSVQHSFGDHSNDSVPSDCAAGNLGLMTQTFEVPNETPPPMPSNISLTTGEEPSPVPLPFTDGRHDYHDEVILRSTPRPKTHYNGGCGMFAKDCPQYKDHHEPRYNCPHKARYGHPRKHRYEDHNGRYKPPRPPHTQSYEPQYEHKPPPRQEPCRLSFDETPSFKPRYEERKPPPQYEEHKPPPRYEERKPPPPRHLYKPEYKERKPPPMRYEERKPPPTRYEEQKPPPPRHL
eukprot:jgi/Psemu1/12602/gm1.12602_g